jgi:hypothetical protein
MAEERTVAGVDVKVRNPWAVALLPFVTLGIYHFVWWYRVNRELRDFGHAKGVDLGQNPTNSLLALVPGFLIVVPTLMTYYNGFKRVQAAEDIVAKEPPNGWIGLALYLLFSPAFCAYMQVALNEVWDYEDGNAARAASSPTEARFQNS